MIGMHVFTRKIDPLTIPADRAKARCVESRRCWKVVAAARVAHSFFAKNPFDAGFKRNSYREQVTQRDTWLVLKKVRGSASPENGDPVERRDAGGFVTKPSHWGCIYKASNAERLGRSSSRWLTIAPNGAIISARALSKVRNSERGHAYVRRQIETCGLPAQSPSETGRAWLERIMPLFTREYHPGNLVFSFKLR